MPIEVSLDKVEAYQVGFAGLQRKLEALYEGRPAAYGHEGDGWAGDINGAAAEYIVGQWRDRFWTPVATRPRDVKADVGENIQAKWTKHRNGCLLLHPEYHDDHYFVLVTGEMPRYWIVGWLQARYGKLEEHWGSGPPGSETDTGRPAFWVPQRKLHLVHA